MIANWSNVTELVRTGSESMLMFVAKLLYPTIFFFAGTLLVLMRKGATAVFAIYFIWGCAKVISQHINFSGYLSLALVLGIVVYCLRLQQLGRLK